MSQYTEGTVNVTNGSNVVTGVGTEWLGNLQSGDLFTIRKTGISYQISSVEDDDSLLLVADFMGLDGTALPYAVTRSFTPNLRVPYPEPRDTEAVAVIKQAISDIDGYLRQAMSPQVFTLTADTPLDPRLHRNGVVKSGAFSAVMPLSSKVEEGWRVLVFGNWTTQGSDVGEGVASGDYVYSDGNGGWTTYG